MRWSFVHALLCIVTGAVSYVLQSRWPLALVGTSSLLFFFITARTGQKRLGGIGYANAVTLVRLFVLFGVATLFGTAWGFALVLALDGLDGFLARRFAESSEFGAHFDMETDALFVALLSMTLAPSAPWVLVAGALRPVFVIARKFFVEVPVERRAPFARYAFGVAAWSMVAALAIKGPLLALLTALSTLVLLVSFAPDFGSLRRA
ncbi:MAG: hypothetical protein DI536_03710 [Archangium gephyra]|uniref:CDP-alcohol phosphatidyltransferase n=1 Tax=Archangium gephyra TaxID=48 RepID=A0A2W5TS40_9BACT|nr:MAG: hypothetical protein DI536_03710 [Archangium gephyra]